MGKDEDELPFERRGRRDPFRPPPQFLLGNWVTYGGPPKPERKKEELEKFEARDMKLESVLLMGSTRKATVRSPDGKSHMVSIGSRVGRFGGTVTAIEDGRIVVSEDIASSMGTVSRQVVIELDRPWESLR